ncbi:MAG: hypothetical protein V4795_12035 [Pseudomonadota bacterium]
MHNPASRRPAGLAGLATVVALLGTGSALAQSSPYYIGVAQSLGHESNLYRVGGGVGLPLGAQSKSDTISSTSLVAGVDQTWGRQRLSGSGSLRADRYARNDQLDNNGYGLNLGLDWATVQRLSGRLGVSLDRSLRSFDPADQNAQAGEGNIVDNNLLSATVRLGVVTRLTAEATASRRSVRYSADGYSGSEYDQGTGSLGVRYRLGGATAVGLAWRQSSVKFTTAVSNYKRRDVDLTGNWDPSGLTSFYARISHTSTDHPQRPARDFSGVTAELRGSTQVSGKVKLSTRLSRDLGQSTSTFDFLGLRDNEEFLRVGTTLRLDADYALSAKITLNAGVSHARRSFDVAGAGFVGSDRTSTLALGARWLPTRAIQVGCNLSHEDRRTARVNGLQVGNPYNSASANCYGQFILQ